MVRRWRRPAVGAPPRRRRLHRGADRVGTAGDRHPAGPAADPAGRRAGAAVRDGAAHGSSRPTRWCRTCRWRSRCATSRASTCGGRTSAARGPGAGACSPSWRRFHAPDDLLRRVCVSDRRRGRGGSGPSGCRTPLHPTKVDAVRSAAAVRPIDHRRWRRCSTTCWPTGRGSTRPAPSRPPARTSWCVIDGGSTAGSDHLMTEGGVDGVTILDLSDPPPRLLDEATVVLDVARRTAPSPAPRWTAAPPSARRTRSPPSWPR